VTFPARTVADPIVTGFLRRVVESEVRRHVFESPQGNSGGERYIGDAFRRCWTGDVGPQM